MARVIVILKERDGLGKHLVQAWPEGTKWGTDKLFNNAVVRTGELWLRGPDANNVPGDAIATYADGEWVVVHLEQKQEPETTQRIKRNG